MNNNILRITKVNKTFVDKLAFKGIYFSVTVKDYQRIETRT